MFYYNCIISLERVLSGVASQIDQNSTISTLISTLNLDYGAYCQYYIAK